MFQDVTLSVVCKEFGICGFTRSGFVQMPVLTFNCHQVRSLISATEIWGADEEERFIGFDARSFLVSVCGLFARC